MNYKIFLKTLFGICLMAMCWMPMNAQDTDLRGDVNGDGGVEISDVTALVDYLLSGDESYVRLASSDIDCDGEVGIGDVAALIDYLLTGEWPADPEPVYEPVYETFTVSNVTFRVLLVEGGTFMMGGREDDPYVKPWEVPAHEVTLSDYYIGETEVTQALWKAVMGSNPSWYQYSYNSDYAYTNDLQRPVENVTYSNVQSFLTKLKQKTGKTFRLPTEAEWEFAARGGNYSKGYMFPGSNDIDEVAWHTGNSMEYLPNAGRDENIPHPVGTKLPNELLIYDMGGNVGEWTSDWYGLYTDAPATNPTGPTTGTARVVRGGSFYQAWRMNRVSYRHEGWPTSATIHVGLRVVLVK